MPKLHLDEKNSMPVIWFSEEIRDPGIQYLQVSAPVSSVSRPQKIVSATLTAACVQLGTEAIRKMLSS